MAMEKLTHNGISLAFEDQGKGAPPILLIHDRGCDRGYSQVQIKRLCCKHRVVNISLPKRNGTIVPQRDRVVTLAHSVAWLCGELGIYKPLAFGNGIGKAVVAHLARHSPDLLATDAEQKNWQEKSK